MNAYDLCLIIDNTQSSLRSWLREARDELVHNRPRREKMTAESAERFFRFQVNIPEGPSLSFRMEILNLITERIDWQEVADHYNLKVSEGASAP